MSDIIDLAPETEEFRDALLRGLSQEPKFVPCKFLYDERGSELFEQICELDEYYPTRTELAIMREHVDEMADRIGPEALIVELGAGSGKKTHLLLEALESPSAYLPIEISKAALRYCAETIGEAFPDLAIHPICADYTEPIDVPALSDPDERTVAYFPGSTIGNFEPGDAAGFLSRIANMCGKGGGLLMGVDLYKSRGIIEPAYNDSEGVTAAFSKNLLRRANCEADADFDLDTFEHRALFDEDEGRIEISQVSQIPQT
ncbi:MAG: L-histidine N(alpha)-methyltransferase, partial [Bradymonadaceae bacterium]